MDQQLSGSTAMPLACPVTGRPLTRRHGAFVTADGGRRYPVTDGIVDLLDEALLDEAARSEIDSFQANPVIGTCYFRRGVFVRAAEWLGEVLGPTDRALRFAELGGGEGYLARHVAEAFDSPEVYVCDISRRHLRLAPEGLHRVRCDVRRRVFQDGALDAAAFWVSLHHFSGDDARRCLAAACDALRPGGALMLFEPNQAFFPRRLLMSLPRLRRKVYFDEAEKHLRCDDCLAVAGEIGFATVAARFVNPPYSRAFLRRLRAGAGMFLATEALHLCDSLGVSFVLKGLGRLFGARGFWGLYFLAMLRKPP